MVRYTPALLLNGDAPAPWGAYASITYSERDVLLYAVGIGCTDLQFSFEKHPQFQVFPTFAIRWGGRGSLPDEDALPPSPGPLTIDAERQIEIVSPLPHSGTVRVRSRLIGVHPRGKGSAFVEKESEVVDETGAVCVRMISGAFRRGVERLGDIESFEGKGRSPAPKQDVPARPPDIEASVVIADNQALLYRLSGDYNPLHIDPKAAHFGGFRAPILHGLCTYGFCGQMLLRMLCNNDPSRFKSLKVRFSSPVFPGDILRVVGWHTGVGTVLFEARVGEQTVVSNAQFTYR
jgi:peroxisomal enoyl-CoA hydratase 2